MPAEVRLSAPAATPLQQASIRVPTAEARQMQAVSQAAHSYWPAPSARGTFPACSSANSLCGSRSLMHFKESGPVPLAQASDGSGGSGESGSSGSDSIRATVCARDETKVNDGARGGDEARSAYKAQAATGGSKNSKVSPISELSEVQETAQRNLKQCANCRQWRDFPGECGELFQCEMIPELARCERGACAQGPRPWIDDAWLRTRCFENANYNKDDFLLEPICENAYQHTIEKLEHKGFLTKHCMNDLSKMKEAMFQCYRKLVKEDEPDRRNRLMLERVAGLRNICSYILKNIVGKARCEDYNDKFQYQNGRWLIADLEIFLDEVSASYLDLVRILSPSKRLIGMCHTISGYDYGIDVPHWLGLRRFDQMGPCKC